MPKHVYPDAEWLPVEWANARDDDTNPTCAVLHVAASEAVSLRGYFTSSRLACSHMYVRRDGSSEQYIRADRLSAADYRGSHRTFSIETQGGAAGEWTDRQCETLARICVWLHQDYDIPLEMMGSSAYNEVGIGWHRLGINGNFPAAPSLLAGRRQIGFGELWSGAFGKVCPGDNRIRQIPGIVRRAREIAESPSMPPFGQGPGSGPLLPTPPSKDHNGLEYDMKRLDLRNAHNEPVRGRHVDNLQGLLMADGYGPAGLVGIDGLPDGVAGVATRRYVGQFQRKTRTGNADGSADFLVYDGTWLALIER